MGDIERVYHFQFTVKQVNDMLNLMGEGPYLKVQAAVNEFQRQIQAQEQQPVTVPSPPKVNGDAQATSDGLDRTTHQ